MAGQKYDLSKWRYARIGIRIQQCCWFVSGPKLLLTRGRPWQVRNMISLSGGMQE